MAGAGFANLVMKASAQLWEDKFMAMRAKKGGSEVCRQFTNKKIEGNQLYVLYICYKDTCYDFCWMHYVLTSVFL